MEQLNGNIPGLSPVETPADKPPRERRPGGAGGRPRKASLQTQIVDGFTGLYMLVGAFTMPFNAYDGQIIVAKSHDMAVALEQAARHNNEVYRVLARIAGASDFTAILMSYGAVAYAIAANHGAVPVRPVSMFDLPLPPERAPMSTPEFTESPGPTIPYFTPGVPQEGWNGEVSRSPQPGPPPPQMSEDIAAAVQSELANKEGLVFPGGQQAMIDRIRAESLRQYAALQASAQRQGPEGMPSVNPNGRL